ncbi:cupin domain-containing protein [Mameliella sediminis]|uniref:cupin domain-containing protein n=1 Tax=Mameliella sediminis TaxID=2836866 RepID=UPI001C452006|nr:cupin domain-containing protein [Mameliella sediminis]MBV7397116.1 cupin domain-containing protein [Mameliella sediminis]MBY6117273.1 cupin domain-containing protein [Antarctobacter heliothermus]MBY6147129.1 cupin domain-containing protein [Mameliella alba]MCA0957135.1 cupin domain-containing protein [Mameliella alba]
MRINLMYSDVAGESHWRDVDVTLTETVFAPPAQDILVSAPEEARAMVFLSMQAGWDEPIHPTPKRQTLFCLRGRLRVTTSDGETREIGPGDILRMEDTTGKGHHTCVIGETDFEGVIVQAE